MDDETRRLLEDAYRQDDQAKIDYERYQREHPPRSAPPEIVRKTFVSRPAPQQTVMDATTQAGWDRWAKAHIKIALAKYNEDLCEDITQAMGEVISEIRRELREHVADEIKKLRAGIDTEIGQLRADMNIQTGIARGEISELKSSVPMKRKQRDVA